MKPQTGDVLSEVTSPHMSGGSVDEHSVPQSSRGCTCVWNWKCSADPQLKQQGRVLSLYEQHANRLNQIEDDNVQIDSIK